MAKRIIILDHVPGPGVGFRYALWADVPAARQPFYVSATATSAYKDASAPELAALQQGQVRERVGDNLWPVGTGIAQIRTDLQAAWTAFQNEVNGRNDWDRYGTSWDGTTWTAGGVA